MRVSSEYIHVLPNLKRKQHSAISFYK